ncbi:MAG TPA: hypothetical protein VGE27_17195 [Gemmatimonas sp.]|uniref:hypothetical protein n=1 Tax=Gemmatimonas sp. TaxID=1962908 RepID=UPI002ED9EB73
MILVAGGAVGYWLYGDRLPSVLSRAASGAANRVTDVAQRASERYDSNDGPRISAEEEQRRQAIRDARDRQVGWVGIGAAPTAGSGPTSATSRVAALNRTLAPLRSKTGPAYVSLSASQVVGVLTPLVQQLPPSAKSVQLALEGDQLLVRAVVSLRDFAGSGTIGTVLGGALDGTDTLYVAGPIEPVQPGLAQFRLRELRLKGIDVPSRLIPPLVRKLRQQGERRVREQLAAQARSERGATSAGKTVDPDRLIDLSALADDGLPIPLPASVSDVRVVNGKLTLYRATPATGVAPTPRTP